MVSPWNLERLAHASSLESERCVCAQHDASRRTRLHRTHTPPPSGPLPNPNPLRFRSLVSITEPEWMAIPGARVTIS